MANQCKKRSNKAIKLMWFILIAMLMFPLVGMFTTAHAAYGKVPTSNVDPKLLKIDEDEYLGASVKKDYVLQEANGNEFSLGDMMGKPLILLFSYYECDGACTTINKTLSRTLSKVKSWNLGEDYQVLTLSFNQHDTSDTLNMFQQHAGFDDGLPNGWRMAVFKNSDDIQKLTQSLGYNFFWEPRDRVFLHPSAYLMLSPEGRLTRVLYGASITAKDIEVSITKAYGSELSASNVINFLVGACYSYNYEDGSYSLSYPIFIASGALALAVASLIGGSIVMRRRVRV